MCSFSYKIIISLVARIYKYSLELSIFVWYKRFALVRRIGIKAGSMRVCYRDKGLGWLRKNREARADVGLSNDRRIAFSAGGIPLKRYGYIVGAIGVCGCNSYDNQMVAEAGARPLTGEYGSAALRPCLNAEPAYAVSNCPPRKPERRLASALSPIDALIEPHWSSGSACSSYTGRSDLDREVRAPAAPGIF